MLPRTTEEMNMESSGSGTAARIGLLVVLAACLLSAALPANTFTVINTADTGAGSLRQAITDANANAGPDTIAFNIPGSGIQTITVSLTNLPVISDPVTIDGTTQPGYAGTPLIEIHGSQTAGSTSPPETPRFEVWC
jgi:hypothetical protein